MGRQPCCDKVGLKKGPWTADEDKKLINFILTNGQCCWRAVPKLAGQSQMLYLVKQYEIIVFYYLFFKRLCIYSERNVPYSILDENDAGLLRCGKSCRLRWTNYLRPDLKRGLLSEYEEKMVIDLHAQLGNRFVIHSISQIIQFLKMKILVCIGFLFSNSFYKILV